MSNAPHILVIDDELQIQRAVRTILTEKGFNVSTASSGEEGLTLAAASEPNIVILDLGLPDMDGVEVCTRLREWTQCPIIILSVRDSERDKVEALDRGADDYLTKPFGIEELMARVRVALRHSAGRQGTQSKVIKSGDLTIDLAWHIVKRGEEEIKLTATEYKLLAYLAGNHGRVLTHQSILTHVWDPADANHTEYLRVYMRQLRKKLELDPERPLIILTEPGIGYRFISDD
ncbi:MAG TPA: response regulator transcription factor [Anaerolineales bacterium]|nr:response regulator transcription factor [Anaerolineales bacterium]HNA90458.1 response regulator transcription factor [Anaerolineales bacterium]HNB37512.1 response regulator transcription factor [Anaerolineales bacterium]